MPFKVYGSTMVTSPCGKGVILIGGYNRNERKESDVLLELTGHSVDTLKWIILEQKLKYPRCRHVSYLIPDDLQWT